MDLMTFDVVVIGGGPAGRALARACAHEGLHTAIVDRRPHRPWTATYGAWADELPPNTPTKSVSTTVRAYAREEHLIQRTYVVLDNAKLHELPDTVEVLQRPEAARYTFNATGARKGRAEQTAVGTVIESDSTETTLMDWRGTGDTFLYTVPLGGNRLLVEETCLARRPGMPLQELRERLHARLSPGEEEEIVRFPLDAPRAASTAFGAAAGFIHPATGYSVATALQLAPQVAAAIKANEDPGHVIWPKKARIVHAMRMRGLEALLRFSPDETLDFFEVFFRLDQELQRAYLSSRDDLKTTAAAMLALFRTAPSHLRWKLLR
ncbi:lycopene cyclase (CrtL-type) [Lentzea flaviverrucosa]|uniref:Lycopene beta-cyclase n=2 Tax=Lentzea flaviverrucosa TaxID=200379 RepID=A0A1H9T5K3_9PSEU|nr:lycopene cyclase (CrtL-type) [Lentzea flaviverrucosa]SER92540.1 lycopene beta-cyclase [Lentzea flaviverrucosa]